MGKRFFAALVITFVVIGVMSTSFFSYAAEDIKADVVYQQFEPYWLEKAEPVNIKGNELAKFSRSLPENQCVIVITENDKVYADTTYEYIGFDRDIFYYVEK